MEQHTDSRYDDDLTVGVDDFESDAIDTDYVDLFEFSGAEESPISRLKTIMLEIDWEITDEVLTQFNEELVDLKDIWSDDPIKLVYVQALQKISKYIYREKSDAHPSAIRLLMSYYYNLEKIDIDTELTEDEKKTILKGDLQKFEKLKKHINPAAVVPSQVEAAEPKEEKIPAVTVSEQGDVAPSLFNLKACILGMDWEITDRELSDLSQEVKRLEAEFAAHKTRLLFLQGIASLGGYIKLKKSDAHADAFKILYSFFEGLEKIVGKDLSLAEEKAVLFPEVEKFKKFKELIAQTITPEAIAEQNRDELAGEYSSSADSSVAPAFSEIEEEDVHGFQAEEEVADLGEEAPETVLGKLDSFFGEDDGVSDGDEAETSTPEVSAEEALRGVDVETDADDDSDEEALPIRSDGVLAPALAGEEEEHGFSAELTTEEIAAESDVETTGEIEDRLSGFFDEEPEQNRRATDRVAALEGVDVESEENGVPVQPADEAARETEAEDSVAPALFDTGEGHGWRDDEPVGREQEPVSVAGGTATLDETLIAGVDVETEADDDSDLDALPTETDGVLAPALSGTEEEAEQGSVFSDDEIATEGDGDSLADIENRLSQFFDADESAEAPAAGSLLSPDTSDEEDEEDELLAPALERPVEAPAFDDFSEEDAVFAGDESLEEPTSSEDIFADAMSTELSADEPEAASESAEDSDIEAELDSFFDDVKEGADEEPGASLFDMPEEPDSAPVVPADAAADSDETVIFEAVDEEEEEIIALGDIPVATLIDKEEPEAPDETTLATFDSEADEMEFFAEIDEKVDEPGEFKQEILEEIDELEPLTPALSEEPADDDHLLFDQEREGATLFDDEEEPPEPEEAEAFEDEFVFTSDDPLTDLRTSISSLGVEINEKIIEGILTEVNSLGQQFMTRPVEKTLLQLMATIVQHIGQYGYESSSEAHGLLLSVFDKLDLIQAPETDALQAQEVLLEETCKVLFWQQRMLDRQAIKKGNQLTFLDPLRSEASETVTGEEPGLALDDHVELEIGEDEFSSEFEPVEDDVRQADAIDAKGDSGKELDPAAADFIKKEIESLKQSLRLEIDELGKKLLNRT